VKEMQKRLKDLNVGLFADRPPINRKKLGPFLRSYATVAIAPFPDARIKHITEATLQQMARDCMSFYWRHAQLLEDIWADPFIDFNYGQTEAGRDFWLSRNAGSLMAGFGDKVDLFSDEVDDENWFALHRGAWGYGPFLLMRDTDDGSIMADYRRYISA
jgi:hypothetical protein